MPDPHLIAHIISDLHHGPNRARKLGSHAIGVLDAMIADARATASPLVVDLGDHINDIDAASDVQHVAQLAESYARVPGARHHLFGDHDLINLTASTFTDTIAGNTGHAIIHAPPLRIVCFAPEVRYPSDMATHGYECADSDLAWLSTALNATATATIVLSHLPLVPLTMAGNAYFEGKPWLGQYRNVRALTAIVRSAPNVVACLAGDTHQHYHVEIDATHFIGLQSATEATEPDGAPAKSWTRVTWTPGALHLETFGARPIHRVLALSTQRDATHAS